MKPLSVLVLVMVAVGVLIFAISKLPGSSSTETLNPGITPDAGAPAQSSAPGTAFDPRAPERQPAEAERAPAAQARTEIRGEGFENQLLGLVQSEGGEPISGAEVTLTRAGGMTMMFVNSEQDRSGDRRTKTRKDGTFSFDNVEPYAHYSLEVDHADYSRTEVNEVDVPLEGIHREPTITLRSGAQLAGFVRDANGVGIPDAKVHLDRMFFPTQGEPTPDRQSTTSDELGYYEIKNISPGNRAMRVQAEGFGNAVINGLSFQAVDKIERDVRLDVAEMICGIVVGPGNTPIPGAEVVGLSFSNSNQQCQEITTTGPDGRFCLEKLSPGKYTVAARATGYRAGRGNRVDTGEANLLIEMEPQATVRGKVIDADTGQPVTAFDILLRQTFEGHEQTSRTGLRQSVAHPGGEFELVDVQPNTYVVEADAPGYAPTFSESFRVTQGQMVAGIVVRINRGGALSGTVVDSSGKPVRRALVETFNNDWTGSEFDRALGEQLPGNATRRQGRTDGDGNFTLTGLTPETYQLRIQAADHCEFIKTDVAVLSGQNRKLGQIDMIQGGSIGGMVLEQAGRPVEGATVVLRVATRTSDAPRYYQTKTNSEGRYNFRNVFPGSYRVMASPPQGRNANLDFLSETSASRSSEQPVTVTDGKSFTVELNLGG